MKPKYLLSLILLVIAITKLGFSQSLKSPSEFDNTVYNAEDTNQLAIPTLPLSSIIKFYQETLSQIKGENCRMYPTCSYYGLEAIQEYGLKGILLSADRLHRCGHDLNFYNKVIVNNKIRFLDKVPQKNHR